MKTRITLKTRIVVNGKEYRSLEELPAELRAAYRKAMDSGAAGTHSSRIVFNGQSYDSPEAMPEEVRRLSGAAMASVPGRGVASPVGPAGLGSTAIQPTKVSPKILTLLLTAAALLGFLYWISRG